MAENDNAEVADNAADEGKKQARRRKYLFLLQLHL